MNPLLHMDPEKAHYTAKKLLKHFHWAIPKTKYSLPVTFLGKQLENPLGLAAGWDKNGEMSEYFSALNFGFAEIGSISLLPSVGNPKPRIWRFHNEKSLLNKMGLPGDGAEIICERLSVNFWSVPLGVSIAKSNGDLDGDAAITDILKCIELTKFLPFFYRVINISCPNSKDGLIVYEDWVEDLIYELNQISWLYPYGLKFSPSSTPQFIRYVVSELRGPSFYVAGNSLASPLGGITGQLLRPSNTKLTAQVKQEMRPEQSLIGCGGIATAADAKEYFDAGANVVQLFTSLIYGGLQTVPNIVKGLIEQKVQVRNLGADAVADSFYTKLVEDFAQDV